MVANKQNTKLQLISGFNPASPESPLWDNVGTNITLSLEVVFYVIYSTSHQMLSLGVVFSVFARLQESAN